MNRHRPTFGTALLGAACLTTLTAGCAAGPAVTGVAVAQIGFDRPVDRPSQKEDNFGAPKVPDPVHPTLQLKDPCSSISPEKARQLGLALPGESAGADTARRVGPYCWWRTEDEYTDYTVGYQTTVKSGLGLPYRSDKNTKNGYFVPTEVSGYPGVWVNGGGDNRAIGFCNLVVGLTDTLTFNVYVQNGDGARSCDQAKVVAESVVATVRGR